MLPHASHYQRAFMTKPFQPHLRTRRVLLLSLLRLGGALISLLLLSPVPWILRYTLCRRDLLQSVPLHPMSPCTFCWLYD